MIWSIVRPFSWKRARVLVEISILPITADVRKLATASDKAALQ
jgi:hypothetical protein